MSCEGIINDMKYFDNSISVIHKELSRIIRKDYEIENAKKLFAQIHKQVNHSGLYDNVTTEADKILCDITDDELAIIPTEDDETIAWSLWHIARIEDITINILAKSGEQIFNDKWKKKMCAPFADTGNSYGDNKMMRLSKSLNYNELMKYKKAVAESTKEFVMSLKPEDMKRKVNNLDIRRVLTSGGVTTDTNSIWLLEYWGGKDVAGLLLMPPTRHAMMHLNSVGKVKESIRTRKKYYLE